MEILPLVFAVVAEVLERDAGKKSKVRHTTPGEEAAAMEKRQLTYNWIVTNSQKLALEIQGSNVMKEETKLETLKNLLISVEKVLDAFDGQEVVWINFERILISDTGKLYLKPN